LLNGNPGEVELVADPKIPEADTAWYLEENANGGVLIKKSAVFGRLFPSQERILEGCDRLEFVSRVPDQL
jgi:hypothetical protein